MGNRKPTPPDMRVRIRRFVRHHPIKPDNVFCSIVREPLPDGHYFLSENYLRFGRLISPCSSNHALPMPMLVASVRDTVTTRLRLISSLREDGFRFASAPVAFMGWDRKRQKHNENMKNNFAGVAFIATAEGRGWRYCTCHEQREGQSREFTRNDDGIPPFVRFA